MTIELESIAVSDLPRGQYELRLAGSRSDVRLSAGKITVEPGISQTVEVHFEGHDPPVNEFWKPNSDLVNLPGLVPRAAKLPGIGRWNMQTVRPYDPDDVPRVRWSRNGRQMACCCGNTIRVLDGSGSRLLHLFLMDSIWASDAAISPDGRWLASGWSDHTVRLWNLETDEAGSVFVGHAAAVSRVAWSPRDHLLASSAGGEVRLWSTDGKPSLVLSGSRNQDSTLSWSADGKWLAAGGLRLWSSAGERGPKVELTGAGPVSFSPDGRWLAVGTAGPAAQIRLFDTKDWTMTPAQLQGPMAISSNLEWGPDSREIAFACGPGAVHFWEPKSNTSRKFDGQDGPNSLASIAWNPDGSIIAVKGGSVGFLDPSTGKLCRRWPNTCWEARRSPDDKWLACSAVWWAPDLRLWSRDGHPGPVLVNNEGCVGRISWSPHADRLAAGHNFEIRQWKSDGKRDQSLQAGVGVDPRDLKWSPDGQSLIYCGAGDSHATVALARRREVHCPFHVGGLGHLATRWETIRNSGQGREGTVNCACMERRWYPRNLSRSERSCNVLEPG